MRDLVEARLHRTRHRVAAQVLLAVMLCGVVAATALTASLPRTLGMALFAGVFLGQADPLREPPVPATVRHARGTHRRSRRRGPHGPSAVSP